MVIDNFIQFIDLVNKFELKNADKLIQYHKDYLNICSCKSTLKNLYFDKTQNLYIEYVNSNTEHIKEKIGPFILDDPILIFKNRNTIFCTLIIN